MRSLPLLLLTAALALTPALFAVADEPAPAAPVSPAVDESVLDVPDGESFEFYVERSAKLGEYFDEVRRAEGDASSDERAAALESKLRSALTVVYLNLAKSPELPEESRFETYWLCVALLPTARWYEVAELDRRIAVFDEIIAAAEARDPNAESLAIAKGLRLVCRARRAVGAKAEASELAALAAELEGIERGLEEKARVASAASGFDESAETAISAREQMLSDALKSLTLADAKVGAETRAKIVAAAKASDDARVRRIGELLEGLGRATAGAEARVEGVFVDGTEFDREAYRGKVVLVDFCGTWCAPCRGELKNIRRAREKYGPSGFEVVGYFLDEDVDVLRAFVEKERFPWKILSRRLSTDSPKGFVDLAEYYGVSGIPAGILIDRDGKIIDGEAVGTRLRELLREQFPEVE